MIFSLSGRIAFAEQDPADSIDSQRAYVDNVFKDIEREKLKKQAEEQAKANFDAKRKRQLEEKRLAEQLKGLSGTLSGLPEIPHFEGRFQDSGHSAQNSEQKAES